MAIALRTIASSGLGTFVFSSTGGRYSPRCTLVSTSRVGPLYGAVILTGLKSIIGTWTEHHLILIGALFMVSVIFLPKGLAGFVLPWLRARFARNVS